MESSVIAGKVVDTIIDELKDWKGMRREIKSMDKETLREFRDDLQKIVLEEFEAATK